MDGHPSALSEQEKRVADKLARELGPAIRGYLVDPEVTEICLNPDGLLWVEEFGQPMKQVGSMTPQNAESILSTIASFYKTTISRDQPILECELPFDGSRFQGLMPPVVAAPTFAIRRKALKVFTLDDYVVAGVMTPAQRSLICDAIDQRLNIVVSGGTGSGKTTLMNALMHRLSEAHPSHRLLLIEDTGELQCKSLNYVTLRSAAHVDMMELLRATLRLRPDRILLGEVRGPEALAVIDAWNTGHPGGACTLHANTAKKALTRCGTLVRRGLKGAPIPYEEIAEAFNVIVSINKTPEGRRVQEILAVTGHDGVSYLTQPYEG